MGKMYPNSVAFLLKVGQNDKHNCPAVKAPDILEAYKIMMPILKK